MKSKEIEIFINFISLVYKNCQKNLSKIKKVDLSDETAKDFVKEIEPYVFLAIELIFADAPYYDFKLFIEDENNVRKLKFKSEQNRFIRYDIFDKYKPHNCIIPEGIRTNSQKDNLCFLMLLVNFMALYDLHEQNEKFFHECLIKLFLVLFGNRFCDRLKDVNSIGRLYEFKSRYMQICKSKDYDDIIEFIYGENIEMEQTLFENYNTVLHIDEGTTNLVSWAFGIETNAHYIDATKLIQMIDVIKTGKKVKIKEVYLPIISKERTDNFFEEGYYGILVDIFSHNNISRSVFEDYPDDLEDISLIVL